MSEFKVGDWVVFKNGDSKLWYVVNVNYSLIKLIFSGSGCVAGCETGADNIRHATPAEKTVGHRIDEVVPKQPENTPEPLVDMGAGVVVKDTVREAFERLKHLDLYFPNIEFNEDENRYVAIIDEQCFQNQAWLVSCAWWAWQARQAEVDQLKNELLAQDKRMMRTFALVQQWRDEAVSPRLGFEPDITGTLESCADELEEALGGGV